MPNMEELLGEVLMAITKNVNKPLFFSTIDLDYAFGQLKMHEDTQKYWVFELVAGKLPDYANFKKISTG